VSCVCLWAAAKGVREVQGGFIELLLKGEKGVRCGERLRGGEKKKKRGTEEKNETGA
jgi:hypothetical protein